MDAYAAEMAGLGVPTERMVIRRDIDLGLFGKLRRYIKAMKPAAVHTHLIHADLHGIVAAKRAGCGRFFRPAITMTRFARRGRFGG